MLKSGGQKLKGSTLGVKQKKDNYVAKSFNTAIIEFCRMFLLS